MTKKLKKRFIQIGMLSFFLVVVLVIGVINFTNHLQNEEQSDFLLSYLAENDGSFPKNGIKEDESIWGKGDFTQETSYSTRYFTVKVVDGEMVDSNMNNIAAVSQDDVASYVETVLSTDNDDGYIGVYKYLVVTKEDYSLIIFLDCNLTQRMEQRFLILSICIAAAGLFFVFLLLLLFSKKAIAPIVDSMEKQNRFITDAGHELKTPLAIISANTEIMEALNGESEWTSSNQHQVERMNELVQQLLMLSRLQEAPEQTAIEEIDISQTIQEEALPFIALAQNKEKELTIDIAEKMVGKTNAKAISQLVSILLDNAVKYADDKSTVSLNAGMRMGMKKKLLQICVENDCKSAKPAEMKHIFERFYRSDPSRSRETGGYGIGLSIAQAVVETYHGEITANCSENHHVSITIAIPVQN